MREVTCSLPVQDLNMRGERRPLLFPSSRSPSEQRSMNWLPRDWRRTGSWGWQTVPGQRQTRLPAVTFPRLRKTPLPAPASPLWSMDKLNPGFTSQYQKEQGRTWAYRVFQTEFSGSLDVILHKGLYHPGGKRTHQITSHIRIHVYLQRGILRKFGKNSFQLIQVQVLLESLNLNLLCNS